MTAIETELLTKRFVTYSRSFRKVSLLAVDRVTLQVPEGSVYVLLGPNGAGKTTLVRMLAGIFPPTEGKAKVLGRDLAKGKELKRLAGIVEAADSSFYGRLTGWENLDFFGSLYGLRSREKRRRMEELLELLGLSRKAHERVQHYSSGMKQRLSIARALLHEPPVLFFDEPTRTLDPLAAEKIREWIREDLVKQRRKTIFLATHNLEEARELSDTIGFMAEGKIFESGSPAHFESRFGSLADAFRHYVGDGKIDG